MAVNSIQDVIRKNLCISCGACVLVAPENTMRMVYNFRRGVYLPEITNPNRIDVKGEVFDVCPGRGYPIEKLSNYLGREGENRDIECGTWIKIGAFRSTDPRILINAASGGIMTAIAHHLIMSGKVSGAIVTKMEYGISGPRPITFIAKTIEELIEAQGSKYCPVPALIILSEVRKKKGKFVFIGTPCQIASLRIIQEKRPEWKQKIPYIIGNFCGGYKDLRNTDTIIRRVGIDPIKVVYFRYRGNGQPGSMLIEDCEGKSVRINYPHYMSMTGYTKQKRCRLCVDATAELADFSCGDAWLPRFIDSSRSWSLLIIRSRKAESIIEEMISIGKLDFDEIKVSEIKLSQYYNILSKKKRQHGRRQLMRMFGAEVPEFDGGYYTNISKPLYELKIHLSHVVKYIIEKVGMYFYIYRLVQKIKGKSSYVEVIPSLYSGKHTVRE